MRRGLAVVVALVMVGCASLGGLRQEPLNKGKVRTFSAAYGDVVDAAREAVTGAKLQIEDAYQPNDRTWVILAKKGTSAWSWGELVRVVVERPAKEDEEPTVYVITKRKGALNVTAKGDYSESIFSGIELALQDQSSDR